MQGNGAITDRDCMGIQQCLGGCTNGYAEIVGGLRHNFQRPLKLSSCLYTETIPSVSCGLCQGTTERRPLFGQSVEDGVTAPRQVGVGIACDASGGDACSILPGQVSLNALLARPVRIEPPGRLQITLDLELQGQYGFDTETRLIF